MGSVARKASRSVCPALWLLPAFAKHVQQLGAAKRAECSDPFVRPYGACATVPGRCILFTTHQMDEADILADQKAVLSQGQIQCLGSSLFLKSKFGVGYHLNVLQDAGKSGDALAAVVERMIGSSVRHEQLGVVEAGGDSEFTFELPLSSLDKFSSVFAALEAEATSLGTFLRRAHGFARQLNGACLCARRHSLMQLRDLVFFICRIAKLWDQHDNTGGGLPSACPR